MSGPRGRAVGQPSAPTCRLGRAPPRRAGGSDRGAARSGGGGGVARGDGAGGPGREVEGPTRGRAAGLGLGLGLPA